ncbi:MAG: type II toxin-antitoxin system VapB family antitoxin [Pseudomonadota bacterium]
MRTTLDLPQDLLEEAMNLTDSKTKTSVIVLALEELIRKRKTAGIKRYRGKLMLDVDTNALRKR